MMCPSMTCVRTCGLTTALGVGTRPGSMIAGTLGGAVGAVVVGAGLVAAGLSSDGGLIGGPRLGIGGFISFVRVGGPSRGSDMGMFGSETFVSGVVRGASVMVASGGMGGGVAGSVVAAVDVRGAQTLVGMLGIAMGMPGGVEVRGRGWVGIIIGVRVGGPVTGPGLPELCNMGGLGLPVFMWGEPGEPGIGEPWPSLGIIPLILRPPGWLGTLFGPGGRPGP